MHYENHSRTLLIPRGLKPKVTERQFIAKTCKNIGKHVQMKAFRQKVLNDDDGSLGRRIRTCFHFCYPPTVLTSIQNSIVVRGKNNQIFSSYIFSTTYLKNYSFHIFHPPLHFFQSDRKENWNFEL